MATFDLPHSGSHLGTGGDIYQNSGQLGRSVFIDSLGANLSQNNPNFRTEYNHRYYVGPSSAVDFTFAPISNPIERGYSAFIRNTGSADLHVKEGAGGTTLTTVAAGDIVKFVARTSGATDTWEFITLLNEVFGNFVYVDAAFGDSPPDAAVHRPDFAFDAVDDANTAAAALTNPVFYVRPGSYSTSSTLSKTGASWFLMPGVTITSTASGGLFAADANVFGRGVINTGTNPFYSGAGGDGVYLEADEIDSDNVTFTGSGNSYVRVNTITLSAITFASTLTGSVNFEVYLTQNSTSYAFNGGLINFRAYEIGTATTITSSGSTVQANIFFERFTGIGSTIQIATLAHNTPANIQIVSRHISPRVTNTVTTEFPVDISGTGTTSIMVDVMEGSALNISGGSPNVYCYYKTIYRFSGDTDIFAIGGSGTTIIDYDEIEYGGTTSTAYIFDVTSTGTLVVNANRPIIDDNIFRQTSACNTTMFIHGGIELTGTVGQRAFDIGAGTLNLKINDVANVLGFMVITGSPTVNVDINNYTTTSSISLRNIINTVNATNPTVFLRFNSISITTTGSSGTAPNDQPFYLSDGTYYISGNFLEANGDFGLGVFTINESCTFKGHVNQVRANVSPVIYTEAITSPFMAGDTNIEFYTDESSSGANYAVRIRDRSGAAGGATFTGLTFGGRLLSGGTSVPSPIRIEHNNDLTMRLVRASLISSGGTPAASVDYTAGATLNIQNHGQIVGQAGYVATGAGTINTIGSATVTNTAFT